MAKMTRSDREQLERLLRARSKAAGMQAEHRGAELIADCEAQLAAMYPRNDPRWAHIAATASAAVAKADAQVAKACEAAGIPADFRPGLSLSWHYRGENAFKARRQELRRVAQTRVDALIKQARATIEAKMVEGFTLLVQDGLETDAAHTFLASLPTVEQLMPPLDVRQLEKLTGKPQPQFSRLADPDAA